MNIIQKMSHWMKKYNAWLSTDPVIWKAMKARNKEGKKSYLVKEWKNDV